MVTPHELNELAKQLWNARMQTENQLEKSAIDAAIEALLQMQARAKRAAV